MARNPSLRTLGVQAEAAGLTLRSTRFGRRPDFAIGPQVEYTKNEQIYGVGVTIALPFWDRKQGEIQTATAEQQKALAEIEKTRLEITGAVTRTAENLELARNQLALYTPAFLDRLKGFVAQAEQSYAQKRDHPHHLPRRQAHLFRHAGQLLRVPRQRRRTTSRAGIGRRSAPRTESLISQSMNKIIIHKLRAMSVAACGARSADARFLQKRSRFRGRGRSQRRKKHDENIVTLTRSEPRARRDQDRAGETRKSRDHAQGGRAA